MINTEAIRVARDADLVATAERLGVSLRAGKAGERIGRCPTCNGDGQLRVDVKAKIWRCNRCHKSGGALGLVMHAHGCFFREAVEFLADSQPRIEG